MIPSGARDRSGGGRGAAVAAAEEAIRLDAIQLAGRRGGVAIVPPRPIDPGTGRAGPWRGEGAIPRIDAARVGMLVFLVAEGMLFGGFIAAFLVFRLGSPAWPPPGEPRLPVGLTALNTAVLLLSGLAMRRAIAALERGDRAGLRRRLGQAVLGGAMFLAIQGFEWARLVRFGVTASSSVYGASFYALIGAHAAHVAAALVWLAVLLGQVRPGRTDRPGAGALAAAALYWGFVVLLWPLLWGLVYLW